MGNDRMLEKVQNLFKHPSFSVIPRSLSDLTPRPPSRPYPTPSPWTGREWREGGVSPLSASERGRGRGFEISPE